MLIVDITIFNIRLTLVNLYDPNSDDPAFYKAILKQVKLFNNKYCIIGGDWNLVLNPDIDTYNYVNVNNPKSHNEVLDIISQLNLVDIWRDHNHELKQFTWRKSTPLNQARLDFFLISDSLYSSKINSNIQSGYRTDHSVISLNFNFSDNEKYSTYWKFNKSLLQNIAYITIVKNAISDVKKQYAVLVYNLDEIDNLPLNDIVFQINDQLFLEVLCMEIRGKTIFYSTLENSDLPNFTAIHLKQEELEKLCQKKMSDQGLNGLLMGKIFIIIFVV